MDHVTARTAAGLSRRTFVGRLLLLAGGGGLLAACGPQAPAAVPAATNAPAIGGQAQPAPTPRCWLRSGGHEDLRGNNKCESSAVELEPDRVGQRVLVDALIPFAGTAAIETVPPEWKPTWEAAPSPRRTRLR